MADQESPIPGYVILEQIAKGGMGIVYKARQKSLDRIVAIKILPRRLSSNEVFVQRFLREAQLAAQLVHPHIVRMLEVGQHGNYYYIVMEFVEGMSLRRLIEGESSLDWRRAVAIIRQTAEALGVAYRKSIVHRDIKPENILITPDGSAKLADMGLAKSLVDDASLTLEGTALGTPHYISPEQGRGEAVDTRSDIYSLGATFYYAVTGFHPFEGPTPASIILKHVTDPLIPPSVRNPSVPRGVCDIIRRMMAKKPAQRYQTPEELLTDLGRLDARGNLPASAAIPGTTQFEIRSSRSKPGKVRTTAGTSRKSTATIIAGVCGAALLLGGIMAFLFRPGTHRPSPIPQTPSNGMPSPRPESITENPVPVPHPRRDPVPSPVNPDDLKNEWAAINASATPDKLRSFINTHRADPMARPFVTKAEEMLDVILQNRIREIRNALDTAKTRSDTCYRTGDFQGTSAPLEEFIQKYPDAVEVRDAREVIATLQEKIQKDFEKDDAIALKAIAEGRLDDAAETYQGILKRFPSEKFKTAAEKGLKTVEDTRTAQESKEIEASVSAVSQRKFSEAAAAADRLAAGARATHTRKEASALAIELRGLDRLHQKLISDLAGGKITARLAPLGIPDMISDGHITGADASGIAVLEKGGSGGRYSISWAQVPNPSYFRLARTVFPGDDPTIRKTMALLALNLRLSDEAREELKRFSALAPKDAAIPSLSKRIEALDSAAETPDRERLARAAFDACTDAVTTKQWDEARRLLDALDKFRNTAFHASARTKIESLTKSLNSAAKPAPPPPPQNAQELLASMGWTIVLGEWNLQHDGTIAGTGTSGLLRAGDASWMNAAIFCKARLTGGRRFYMAIRSLDVTTLPAGISATSNPFRIGAWIDMTTRQTYFESPITRGPIRNLFEPDGYHEYRLFARNKELEFFADGRSRGKTNDHDYLTGYVYIGFGGGGDTRLEIRDLKVINLQKPADAP